MKKLYLLLLVLFGSLKANNPESVLKFVQENNIQFIEFSFTDFLGNRKSIMQPVQFLKTALENGIYFDGSSVRGCNRITESDMLLMPDCSSIRLIPWTEGQTKMATIMGDMYVVKNQPYQSDPRNILKKILRQADDMGFGFMVGPELEFYVFDINNNNVQLPPKPDNSTYVAAHDNCNGPNLINTIFTQLQRYGLEAQKYHREVSDCQHEIVLKHDKALAMADKVVLAKHAIKALGLNYNYKVSYMPKPIFGQNGSGMHIHFSLVDNTTNKNLFYDADDHYNLSDIAKSFIAGVLAHAREMAIIFNPSINSYKRLVRGYEAPVNICVGTKNRSGLIRIPQFDADDANAARAEIRCPDPLCNPYLAFAALLQAGLDGIKKGLTIDRFVNENLFELDAQAIAQMGIDMLPASLQEALEEFEKSSFMKELLGENLFNAFIKEKTQEIQAYKLEVTDWELKRYL